MAIYRLQCEFAADTAFPRDRLVMTPHFSINQAWNAAQLEPLCNDLATQLETWEGPPAREIRIKAYDAQGTVPVFPVATITRNVGLAPTAIGPREVALCLSFFGGQNVPRRRGRLYVPWPLLAQSSGPGLRPTTAFMQKVADLVPIFTNLGGIDVDWCVFSRKNSEAYSVSNWWVDDEWDTIRSRGMRPTTRIAGTASE